MKTVTAGFKTTAKGDAKEVVVSITDGTTTITGANDIKSFKIYSNGGIYKTLLRQAEVVYWGGHDFLGEELNIKFGYVVSGTPEYIDFGDFKVVEVEEDKANNTKKIKLYDKMYEALQLYETVGTFPQDIATFLGAICTELGWTLGTPTFFNDDLEITLELFLNQDLTYRDVLNYIAEVTGTIIYFDENNELVLTSPDTDTSLETLVTNDLFSLKLEPKWGELNSLALAREPQNDVIVEQDEVSIAANGLWELRFVNNLILDTDRETYITPLFTEIKGLEYYPFEAKTVGLGYFEVGDTITLTDKDDNTYRVLITDVELDVSGGVSEIIKGVSPEKSSTDYKTAGIIGKRITNTEIIVNKQEGEIQILNQAMETVATIPRQATAPENPETNDLWLNTTNNIIYIYDGGEWVATSMTTDDLTDYFTKDETLTEISTTADSITASVEATQTTANSARALAEENSEELNTVNSQLTELGIKADGLDIKVENIGGSNLIINSVGLKGTITEWQEFDSEGNLIDSDNDAVIVQTSNVRENTESGSGLRLEGQFITQEIPTVVGMTYTFSCRFVRDIDCDLFITGQGTSQITTEGYTSGWDNYSKTFTATSSNTKIRIDNRSYEGYIIVSDIICKMGFVAGWTQAPNEVYGKNYRFDTDGFSVSSETSPITTSMDNTRFAVLDTSNPSSPRIVAYFSHQSGKISRLIAQEVLSLQRYENPSSRVRFIPTSTGCMVVVND